MNSQKISQSHLTREPASTGVGGTSASGVARKQISRAPIMQLQAFTCLSHVRLGDIPS